MTTTTGRSRPPRTSLISQIPEGPRNLVLAVGAAGMAAVASQMESVARVAVGGVGLFVIILIALSDRDLALVAITTWMVFLGFTRRFLIPFAGWSDQDPLLLVSPAVAVVLLVTGRRLGTPPRTLQASVVLFLVLWSATQMFNPEEASIAAAAQASLFYVTPPLWFFVGRTLTLEQHDRIIKVLFWLSVPVVGHGLRQSFIGLLPFEYTWIGVSNIGASIFLPGFVIRPFSTLVSPQEYGIFLVLALVIIFVRMTGPTRHRGWLIIYFLTTIFALFLQASRTTFLIFILTMAVLTVARVRSLGLTLAALGLIAGVMLFSLTGGSGPAPVEEKAPEGPQGTNVAANITHQLAGFTNPDSSTAPLHIELILDGFGKGLANPLGLGASHATLADTKAYSLEFKSAENDIANTMAALGLPAGLALVLFMLTGLGGARRLYRQHRDPRSLVWLGFGVGCLFNWYSGGQYTTTMLLWMAMGGVSRQIGEQRMAKLRALTPSTPDAT